MRAQRHTFASLSLVAKRLNGAEAKPLSMRPKPFLGTKRSERNLLARITPVLLAGALQAVVRISRSGSILYNRCDPIYHIAELVAAMSLINNKQSLQAVLQDLSHKESRSAHSASMIEPHVACII